MLEERKAAARVRVEGLREEGARLAVCDPAPSSRRRSRVRRPTPSPPYRLRVDDSGRGLGLTALAFADLPAQPVVELGDQPVLAPPAEEGVNAAPGREVRGHGPPRDSARDQVADRVQQLPVAVALGLPASALEPGRHRQQRPHGRPLRVRHVRRILAHPIGMTGRVAVHVREAIARDGGRVARSVEGRLLSRH